MKDVDSRIEKLRLKGGAVTTDTSAIIEEVKERERDLTGKTFNELQKDKFYNELFNQ